MAVSAYTYDTAAPAEQGALPTADEVAAALDTPVQVHGQQPSLAEHIERLEQERKAAPRIDWPAGPSPNAASIPLTESGCRATRSVQDISAHTAPHQRAFHAGMHTAQAFLVRDYLD
jgi:hypothetical protein